MHELSIVQALIQQVDGEVRQRGVEGRVTRLDLVIGRLSGVSVDAVRFGFEVLAPGTLLEAAVLHVDQPRAECLCRACGSRTPIDELTLDCPHCGSHETTIEGGRQMLLQSIELEDGPPEGAANP